MIPLLVTSAYPATANTFAATRARAALAAGEIPGFTATTDPAVAQAILFFEHHPDSDPFFLSVLRHPLVRRYPRKCLLSHDADFVVPAMSGFYPSLTRDQFRTDRFESWVYLNQQCPNPEIRFVPATGHERHLFSFVGAVRTHPVRSRLMALPGPGAYLEDTSGANAWQLTDSQRHIHHLQYARRLADSLFVLCPRGVGPNSYRVGEAMQTGRVPVIISDEFPPPPALPWADFAVFVAEAEVESIPQRLAAMTSRAVAMGNVARAVWERHYRWPSGFAQLCAQVPRLVAAGPTRFPFLRALSLVCRSSGYARLFVRSLRARRAVQ